MKKAIVERSTGIVLNVIELEPDNDGTFNHWQTPDGCDLIDSDGAGPGWTWDGAIFSRPPTVAPLRLNTLMAGGPATQVYNAVTEVMDDRPAEDIAADKAELLGLLQAKLAASEDLTWDEMNKMLALERES
jgi:hypothetical protein